MFHVWLNLWTRLLKWQNKDQAKKTNYLSFELIVKQKSKTLSGAGDSAPAAWAAGPAAGQLRWEGLLGGEATEAGGRPVQRARLQPAGERPSGQWASHQRHSTLQVSRVRTSAQVMCVFLDLHKKTNIELRLHIDLELCRKNENSHLFGV